VIISTTGRQPTTGWKRLYCSPMRVCVRSTRRFTWRRKAGRSSSSPDCVLPAGFEPNRLALLIKLRPGFPDAAPDQAKRNAKNIVTQAMKAAGADFSDDSFHRQAPVLMAASSDAAWLRFRDLGIADAPIRNSTCVGIRHSIALTWRFSHTCTHPIDLTGLLPPTERWMWSWRTTGSGQRSIRP
jgi:hypothetical protein